MCKFLLAVSVLCVIACEPRSANENEAAPDSIVAAPSPETNAPVQFDTVWVAGVGDERPDVEFYFEGRRFHLAGADTIRAAITLLVQIPRSFVIEKVRVAKLGRDFIVLADITDSESGNGILARFDSAGSRKWHHPIPAFNIATPVVRGNAAFVSGIGFVEKVDLNTGQPVWRHAELYDQETGAFNAFKPARFVADTVIFEDERSSRSIKVLESSGQIIAE